PNPTTTNLLPRILLRPPKLSRGVRTRYRQRVLIIRVIVTTSVSRIEGGRRGADGERVIVVCDYQARRFFCGGFCLFAFLFGAGGEVCCVVAVGGCVGC